MSYEDIDVTNALISKLYEVLFSSEGNPRNSFFSLVEGGFVFAPEDFSFLLEPRGLTTAPHNDRARNFASLVNGIPEAVGRWNSTSTTINYMYKEEWLRNIDVPNIPLNDNQKRILEEALEFTIAHRTNYNNLKSDFIKIENKISVLERKYNRTPADDELLGDLKAERDIIYDDWVVLGRKNKYEESRAEIERIDGLGYDKIVSNLVNKYESTLNTYRDSADRGYTPVILYPPSFSKPDFEWNKYNFHINETEKYVHNSTVTWGGSVGGIYKLFWGKGGASGETRKDYTIDKTEGFQVTFDFLRVILDRSLWFETGLLKGRRWWWHGATVENPTFGVKFCNGEFPGTTGEWQMIPEEAIFAKNLVVSFNKTNTVNKTTIEKIKASASGGFLPFFRIKGKYNSEDTREVRLDDSIAEGIFCPDMQIIGFRCSILPKCPNPDPSYMRRTAPSVRDLSYRFAISKKE